MARKARSKPAPAPLPAMPYEPTPKERKALAAQQARRASRAPHPSLRVSPGPTKGVINLAVDHQDALAGELLLSESLGTSDAHVASFLVEQIGFLAEVNGTISGQVLNRQLAMVQDIGPRDTAEAMLACQMVAVHVATMAVAASVHRNGATPERKDANIGHLNKLGRTFAAQMETLKRYRSKGDQKMTVEHKHYHLAAGALAPGSQAVLGDVTQGGGAPQQTEAEPHERSIPERPAMLGNIEANGAAMPWPSGEGLEGVPVPRSARWAEGGTDA